MQTNPRAAIYGHRGARAERPENTMDGFLHAVAFGVTGIETDIALTADFCPVLHHDPELADGRRIKDVKLAACRPRCRPWKPRSHACPTLSGSWKSRHFRTRLQCATYPN